MKPYFSSLVMPSLRPSAVAFCVAIFLLSLFGCSRDTYRDVVQDFSDHPAGEITQQTVVGQSFKPNHPNLNGVAVMLATYARTNNCHVVFHLRPEGSPQDVFAQKVNCAEIRDNEYRQFNFPSIKDSGGKRYVFYFDSPDSSSGNAITVWMASIPNIYPDGQALVNGKPVPGALRFVTFHD